MRHLFFQLSKYTVPKTVTNLTSDLQISDQFNILALTELKRGVQESAGDVSIRQKLEKVKQERDTLSNEISDLQVGTVKGNV